MPPREFDEESANQETHLLGTSKRRDRIIEGIEESALSSSELLSRSRNLLYLSHFFNQFSENFWQFCVILFLAAFSNYESLVLICSYGLVSASFVCFFGSAAGRFVDGTNRLVVARRLIGFENCAVLLATLCCYLLLSKSNYSNEYVTKYEGVPVDPWSLFLLFWIHILGAGAKVLDTGFLVAVERDWIVVMSKCAEDQTKQTDQLAFKKAWLSDTNVAMKQIDLSCKVVAPAVAGFFVAAFPSGHSNDNGANLIGAAILVGAINISALFVEYACTAQIYANIPSLAFKRVTSGLDRKPLHADEARQGHIVGPRKQLCLFTTPEALKVYLTQDISYAGIGLSMLYVIAKLNSLALFAECTTNTTFFDLQVLKRPYFWWSNDGVSRMERNAPRGHWSLAWGIFCHRLIGNLCLPLYVETYDSDRNGNVKRHVSVSVSITELCFSLRRGL